MHAAKGLEFPVVFIVGCEEGYLPLHRPNTAGIDIAEELRLFYVAMTRAKERLYLTHAKKRTVYGKTETRALSPFVGRIEDLLKTHERQTSKKKKNKGSEQLKLF
jgi:superfamily I DNA/RNA helicase